MFACHTCARPAQPLCTPRGGHIKRRSVRSVFWWNMVHAAQARPRGRAPLVVPTGASSTFSTIFTRSDIQAQPRGSSSQTPHAGLRAHATGESRRTARLSRAQNDLLIECNSLPSHNLRLRHARIRVNSAIVRNLTTTANRARAATSDICLSERDESKRVATRTRRSAARLSSAARLDNDADFDAAPNPPTITTPTPTSTVARHKEILQRALEVQAERRAMRKRFRQSAPAATSSLKPVPTTSAPAAATPLAPTLPPLPREAVQHLEKLQTLPRKQRARAAVEESDNDTVSDVVAGKVGVHDAGNGAYLHPLQQDETLKIMDSAPRGNAPTGPTGAGHVPRVLSRSVQTMLRAKQCLVLFSTTYAARHLRASTASTRTDDEFVSSSTWLPSSPIIWRPPTTPTSSGTTRTRTARTAPCAGGTDGSDPSISQPR